MLRVRSICSALNTISDPRIELLIAQRSLIDPWIDCIEGQRPAMPIVTIEDDPIDDEWKLLEITQAQREPIVGGKR